MMLCQNSEFNISNELISQGRYRAARATKNYSFCEDFYDILYHNFFLYFVDLFFNFVLIWILGELRVQNLGMLGPKSMEI